MSQEDSGGGRNVLYFFADAKTDDPLRYTEKVK